MFVISVFDAVNRVFAIRKCLDLKPGVLQGLRHHGKERRGLGTARITAYTLDPKMVCDGLCPNLGQMTPARIVGADKIEADFLPGIFFLPDKVHKRLEDLFSFRWDGVGVQLR